MDSPVDTLELVAGSLLSEDASGSPGESRTDSGHNLVGRDGSLLDRVSNHRCSALVGPRQASDRPK